MATEIEFGVNDCDARENPFEKNFDTEDEAIVAGEAYLRDTPECSAVVIFKLTIVKDQIVSDDTLRTIKRSELVTTCNNLQDHFKNVYAYQAEVKDSPLIQAWLSRVASALAAMANVEVEFATTLHEQCDENKVYHDHDNQIVAAFLAPVLTSSEGPDCMDEECLPYYRVRFADGVELLADDAELFSLDPKFMELLNAVSGAFGCARELDFVGPWHLAAKGTEEDKAKFLAAFNGQEFAVPPAHWAHNHNTPAKYRVSP